MSRIYIVHINEIPRCYEPNRPQAEKTMRKILQTEFMTEPENKNYHIQVLAEEDDVSMYRLFAVPKNSPVVYDGLLATSSITVLTPGA